MMRPEGRGLAFLRSFLRSYMVAGALNVRGMQNVGYAYSMDPGLVAIHGSGEDLRRARKRYVRFYNSHPFWTPCLVGIFLHAESLISQGRFPERMLDKVKDTTGYTLSAIGDSVFAGSVLIFWVLASACLLLAGQVPAAVALSIIFLVSVQLFRAYTFFLGVRKGFKALEDFRKWNLIDWGQRLKYANAALLLWLWFLIWPKPILWWEWALGLGIMAATARLLYKTGLPRELMVPLLVLVYGLLPSLFLLLDAYVG